MRVRQAGPARRARALGAGLPFAWLAVIPAVAVAQAPSGPIQDNSFLVEEAYNQEAGVVQHINTFIFQPASHAWSYSFTQEWPAGGLLNQLSYTLVVDGLPMGSGRRTTRLGDALLNYRYQLVGDGGSHVAVAPRISLVLPTGSVDAGAGRGALGYQFNLPASVTLGGQFVAHLNAGFTWTPRAKAPSGPRASLADLAMGGSVIWLVRERFNVMLEALWTRSEDATATGPLASRSLLLSPGVRWAYNFTSGLQIVPGVAVPFELSAAPRQASIFAYLSFEHPF